MVTCTYPDVIANASVLPEFNGTVLNFSDQLLYSCDMGFEVSGGSEVRECQDDGRLSGEPLQCQGMSSLINPTL